MKIIIGLFFIITASSAAELYERRLLGNHLEDLITEALEYVRSLLKKYEPYPLPNLKDQFLADTDVDLLFTATDAELFKSSNFKIDSIKVDPNTLKASFQITVPLSHVEGYYKISGIVKDKKADGAGPFSLNVTNLVLSGNLEFDVIDHSIQIKSLTWDFSIGDFKINVDGLSIEGFDKQQINNLLDKQFINLINDYKPFVEQLVTTYVVDIANYVLYGSSLDEIIAWLEKLVASTPDFLPYPTLSP